MSREEREALLGAETPDLPDRTSPYRQGARRLVGIIVVSLVISAAVSLTLVLALTGGLRERVKRDVLADLAAAGAAEQPTLPEQAVLVYVPDRCRHPLPDDLPAHVRIAASPDVLAATVADAKVQQTPWYAAHAAEAAAALADAARVVAVPGTRLLAFHSDRIDKPDREVILARWAAAYVAHCRDAARLPLPARLEELRRQQDDRQAELDANRADYAADTDSARAELGLAGMQRRLWQQRVDRARTVVATDTKAGAAQSAAADWAAAERIPQLDAAVEADRERAAKAELVMQRCRRLRDRLAAAAAEVVLTQARYAEAADDAVPRLCGDGMLMPIPADAEALQHQARMAPPRAELAALRPILDARRQEAATLSDKYLQFVSTHNIHLLALQSRIEQLVEIRVQLEWEGEIQRAADDAARAASQPATEPASRPADRFEKLQEAIDGLVEQYAARWKRRTEAEAEPAKAELAARVADAIERRIDELQIRLATETRVP